MKASQTISRNLDDTNPYGFDRLRREGIEISQNLSGLAWTDYNYHDPGVTILEQLCFALTDLIYRTKFDVGDYLCDEQGFVDTTTLGLHSPQDVFFSRPGTVIDYQKAIFDSTPGLSDVQVFAGIDGASAGGYGLYKVRVRKSVDEQVIGSSNDLEIKEATRVSFHAVRNLCEDLDDDIEVVSEIDCYLDGEISIRSGYRAASVLAELYFLARQVLVRSISFKSFSEDYRQGKPLDEVFTGPFTGNGIIDNAELERVEGLKRKHELESAILSASREVEGIEYVAALSLRPAGSRDQSHSADSLQKFRLVEPETPNDFSGMNLKSGGRKVDFSLDEFRAQFDTLKFAKGSRSYKLEEDQLISSPPTGNYRELSRYQSVQNQFPDVYGINQYGVPESYPNERKAQALQLKSYLLLFEQIMSNYLANLGSIRRLFSVKGNEDSSYTAGVLNNDEISSLGRVYPDDAANLLDDILGKIDNFVSRKSRLLDYLLALYGEEFSQDHLRNFNFYQNDSELQRSIILNKIRLLNRVKFLSGDRGGAVNLLSEAIGAEDPAIARAGESVRLQNVSGLQYRLGIFLGFRHLMPRSLVKEIFRHDLNLLPHSDYRSVIDKPGAGILAESEYVRLAKELYREIDTDNPEDDKDERYHRIVRDHLVEIGPLRRGLVSEAILQSGVHEDNYVYDGRVDDLQLVLSTTTDSDEESEVIRLLVGKGKIGSKNKKKFLRCFLTHLNSECEGMHVLEHILLRPSDFENQSHELKEKYANRVSVVFPAWTARCNQPEFRSIAEDLVRENCPAHISPDVYWLSFAEMCEFEVLLQRWQELYRSRNNGSDPLELDAASRALLRFLSLNRSKDGDVYINAQGLSGVREDIDFQLSLYVSRLLERRKEIGLSERRLSDEEQQYLYGIELLQSELGKFKLRTIEHMRLLDKDSDLEDDDWNFYVSTVSVILPKLYCFRISSGQTAHFHAVKSIVEDGIRAAVDPGLQVNFHWLVPADMKKIRCLRARWLEQQQNATVQPVDSSASASKLRQALQKLNAAQGVTGDIRQWVSVLGDQ